MSVHRKFIIPVFAASILLSACGGGTAEDVKDEIENVDGTSDAETEEVDFILPQPITLASQLKESGLPYVEGKANPTSNEGKYSKKIDQLVNLGVYSTDLAYCAINGKAQEARNYLTSIQKLGSAVGLESVFADKDLISRFDKNLGNPGELENLIYEIQERSDVYMEDNDLRYLAAVQFAGAWVEGMYLGIDNARSKKDIGLALVEQMSLLKNIIIGLKANPVKDDPRLNDLIAKYEDVLNTYHNFAAVKAVGGNVNTQVPELSETEFAKLAAKITTLRNNIVSPSK
jgi:hypothetical protein